MLLRRIRDTRADAEAVHSVAVAAPASEPQEWTGPQIVRFQRKTRHLAGTDPQGCWLAEDAGGRPLGAALATRREGLWVLSLLAVAEHARGNGVGRELLLRSLHYGRGSLRGMIRCPGDPRAARAYRRAGFTLHPAMRMTGRVDPEGLPAPDGPAIEGGPAHRDMMDSVDRRLRGGAHGPDHGEMLLHHRVVVADDLAGSGYCYVTDAGRIELLAATSRRVAVRLLTSALLSLEPGSAAVVPHLTAEQEWAVDVGLDAGLEPAPDGYLCLRGMRPPQPYIPSSDFL